MPYTKIKMDRIACDRTRQNTFHKRKLGLVKKAIELSVLCDCECTVLLRSGPTPMYPQGKTTAYCNKDLQKILNDFVNKMPQTVYTNAEYERFNGHSSDQSDETPVDLDAEAGRNLKPPTPATPFESDEECKFIMQQLQFLRSQLSHIEQSSTELTTTMDLSTPTSQSSYNLASHDCNAPRKPNESDGGMEFEREEQEQANKRPHTATLEQGQAACYGAAAKKSRSCDQLQREKSQVPELATPTSSSGPDGMPPLDEEVLPSIAVPSILV